MVKEKGDEGEGVRMKSEAWSAEVCLYIFPDLMIEFCPALLRNCCGNACFCGQILKYCNVFTQTQRPMLSMRRDRNGGWKKHCMSPFSSAFSKYWTPVLHNESFFSLQLPQPCDTVGPAASAQKSETHGDQWLGAEGSCSGRDAALLPRFYQCG